MKKIFLLLIIITSILYATTDYIEKGYQSIHSLFFDNDKKLVTYYQWTADNGETVISQNKPADNIQYISFESTAKLTQNENVIDQSLINKGQAAERRLLNQTNQKVNTINGRSSGSTSAVSGTILSAPQKVKDSLKNSNEKNKKKIDEQ